MRNAAPQNVFIFDLGGGTFDISILRVEKGQFNVLATKGDSHLGGEDIDNRLLSFFLQELNKQHNIRFDVGSPDLVPVKRKLKKHVEHFKHAFASQNKVEMTIDCVAPDANGDLVDLKLEMTRAKFDSSICGAFTEKAMAPIQEVLDMAKLTKDQIDTVLLVGGSTRLPKVRDELSRFFPPEKISKEVNPDEAVAQGAAILAGIVSKVEIQKPEGIHVSDATSFPIGVAVANDGFSILIEKSITTPCSFTKNYSTHRDNQPRLRFVIYEGENREKASLNQQLAELIIPLPAESVAGSITVSITFSINENGILEITAVNQQSGETQQVEITYQAQIDPNELAEYVKEEKVLATLPEKEKARAALENAVNIVLETTGGDAGYAVDGISQDEIAAIVGKATEIRNWLGGINFYDLAITPVDFQDKVKQIKKTGPDAFTALEEEFYAPQ
jgi:molecular chaperone DnaK (HSP70)